MAWYWWILIGGVGGAALLYLYIIITFARGMHW